MGPHAQTEGDRVTEHESDPAGGEIDGETIGTEEILALVTSVRQPSEVSLDYDRAVGTLEQQRINQAMTALMSLDIDSAARSLHSARKVRVTYLTLVGDARLLDSHPLSEHFDSLYNSGESRLKLIDGLSAMVDAQLSYQNGKAEDALRRLEQSRTLLANDTSIDGFFASLLEAIIEVLTGTIRRSVLDFAGARAAFDRASTLVDTILRLSEAEGFAAQPEIEVMRVDAVAQSKMAQYQQRLGSSDYVGAIEVALAGSEALSQSAQLLESSGVPGSHTMVAIKRAAALEARANACQAQAYAALEEGDFDQAALMVRKVGDLYEEASCACLLARIPVSAIIQERMLNQGYSWSVAFKRTLDRERSHFDELRQVKMELGEVYANLRGALAPSGIVVNNANEMISTVEQHAKFTNNLEVRVRARLQELPAALSAVPLPNEDSERISAELEELLGEGSDDSSFFERVNGFGRRLAETVRSYGESANVVLEIIRSLSLIG